MTNPFQPETAGPRCAPTAVRDLAQVGQLLPDPLEVRCRSRSTSRTGWPPLRRAAEGNCRPGRSPGCGRPGQDSGLGFRLKVADPVRKSPARLGLVPRSRSAFRGEDELGGAPVPLVVLQPRLAEAWRKLILEPARDHVHRDPGPAGQVVRGGHPTWPAPRVATGPGGPPAISLRPLGGHQQREAESLSTRAGTRRRSWPFVPDLAQRIVEPGPARPARARVRFVVERPVGCACSMVLVTRAAADVGHPVGEAERLGGRDRWSWSASRGSVVVVGGGHQAAAPAAPGSGPSPAW